MNTEMMQGARVVSRDGLQMQPPGKSAASLVSLQGCFQESKEREQGFGFVCVFRLLLRAMRKLQNAKQMI